MAIKLSPVAYKELKAAMRDYKTKGKVEKLLTNIQVNAYQQGYQDAYDDASRKIQDVVNGDTVTAVDSVPTLEELLATVPEGYADAE